MKTLCYKRIFMRYTVARKNDKKTSGLTIFINVYVIDSGRIQGT